MAGPTLGILTRDPVSIPEEMCAASRVGHWRQRDVDGDGWLDERPIFLAHENETWEGYDQPSVRALHRVLGWKPCESLLVVAAMSNEPIDHQLVARVAVAVLSDRDGAVDYSGALKNEPLDLPGWALQLRYATAAGGHAQAAVVSAEWLTAWAEAPEFRLIK